MSGIIKALIVVVVVGALAVGATVLFQKRSQPAVTVTLRIAVAPETQVDFVKGRANSAQFKYLLGKQAGVKPVLAQKLTVEPLPHSPLLEAQIAVPTKDDAQRYVEVFVPTLQGLCGRQAQVTLAEQTIR